MRRSRKPQRRAQQRWAMAERCSALRPPRLVVRTRVRSGFPMAIQCGCADGWRRFRSAGTRSRFFQPVTRHRCKGLPRRVAASKSGDESPHSERQALHPCPQAVIFRSSAGEEGQARPPPLPASCPPESPGIERMKKRPQPRQREVYWLVTGKAKWRS
jgi:hypothetical protein